MRAVFDSLSSLTAILRGALHPRRSFLTRQLSRLHLLNPPRHFGSFAALAFLMASAAYGITLAGFAPDFGRELAKAANLSIQEIRIEGQDKVPPQDVVAALKAVAPGGVMTFNADKARQAVEAIGWIETAEILKLYPGTVKVRVTEHEPFALWQRADQVSVIAYDGTVLADYIREDYAGLPLFVGTGANDRASDLMALVAPHTSISEQLRAAVFVGKRRWDLILTNGTEIRLPELNPELAMSRVSRLAQQAPIIDARVAIVDVRLSDRIVMRRADGLPVGEPDEEAGT